MRTSFPDWGQPEPLDDIGCRVAIVGVGEATHSTASGRTATEIALQAVKRALDDAGLSPHDVDGLMCDRRWPCLDASTFRDRFRVRQHIWTSDAGGGMV